MAGSQWVIDVSMSTFQREVVDRSRQVPVVIDFWAPWCGPCRALGPVLEALAAEKAGQFVLAKVNTDENPELAQAFQVEGIPAVYAVRHGKLVDRFEGALPEAEVRRFVEGLLGGAGEQPEQPAADPAAQALELEGRDPKAAVAAYRGMLSANPDDPAGRLGLARTLLASPGNEAEAAKLLEGVEFADQAEEADRLRTVITLREVPHSDADLRAATDAAKANPSDAQARLRLGRVLAARGDYTPALDTLLAAAEEDRALGRSEVRELMVQVFAVIGPRSEQADEYRRRLQNVLY